MRSEQPAFWFGFEVTWAKLVAARVLVFGVLAVDALLQIRHAPRYGAGGFNVAQLPWLDHWGPGRVAFGVSQLVIAACCTSAALGVAARRAIATAGVLYAWLYFGSQVDSYQHHYLVVLVLLMAAFVPWERPRDATAATPVRSWALRLILVQLALLYLWAAISKLDAAWLDGRTLSLQLGSASGTPFERLPAVCRLIETTIGWAAAAKVVLASELVLAGTVWHRRGWWIAAPLGIAFHAGIALTNLEIGLFAYIMIAAYALAVPDAAWVAIARALPRRPELPAALRGWPATAIAAAVAIAVAMACRFDSATAVALSLAMCALVLAALRARRRAAPSPAALALLAATLLWVTVDRASSVAVDYYRLWGGSSRRLGDLDDAARAYRRLVALEPDNAEAHYRLGRALVERDGDDAASDGVDELHAARALAPHRAEAWLEEARWLAHHGRRDEALAAARAGLAAQPGSNEARTLVDALASGRGGGANAGAGAGAGGDE